MPVQVIKTVSEMQARSRKARREGLVVGCVPTMGFLHEGHLSLIRECARKAELVIMTLFVNPAQFAEGEDLDKYPRDFEGDCKKAGEAGAHTVFYPDVSEMYPKGFQTYVEVEDISRDLEGARRPTHFRGVATVVTKLFNITLPHLAVFGEKDYQQLKLIERMSKDLDMGVRVIGMPTIRETDGLAMSSRNKYLTPEQRERALSISRALFDAEKAVKAGEKDPAKLEREARDKILQSGLSVDYAAVRDPESLMPVESIDSPARMLLAARTGDVRLIDNLGLFPGG